ncbi:signal peptide containing protein [Theileria equi strain WA]|uniref:Signal peptide containing protein n=1 Tax=Theileria equi strain WA TaxID=1537102 RepID=L1LE10_THEEQ|nr:signal peptide containing protein [Theileria equi strain WA]EKX73388.1 signal peptide containing protein [Theileria equi strain WA]|eukprot:XP_004832840.1 signal peptide containing protein [Theileria equi strain WA]
MFPLHVLIFVCAFGLCQCGDNLPSESGEGISLNSLPVGSGVDNSVKGEGLMFDILNPPSNVYNFHISYCGIEYDYYSARDGDHFLKVSENSQTLWKEQNGKICNKVRIYHTKEEPVMIVLTVDDQLSEYFEKVDGTWKSIAEDEHHNKLEGMKDSSNP